jgi:DNA-directed RNA polymerase
MPGHKHKFHTSSDPQQTTGHAKATHTSRSVWTEQMPIRIGQVAISVTMNFNAITVNLADSKHKSTENWTEEHK